MIRHSPLLLTILVACAQPPELEAESSWVQGPCGHQEVQVQVHTDPGVALTLERTGQAPLSGVADEAGTLTLTMPVEEYGSLSLVGERSGQETRVIVPGPPAIIRNTVSTGTGSSYNTCTRIHVDKPACKAGLEPWGVSLGPVFSEGSWIRLGDKTATVGESKGATVVPVPLEAVTAWDFSVFSGSQECPHLAVPGVEANIEGTRYAGEIWTSRIGAEHAVAHALGATVDGEPWTAPPTGDVALVVRRTSDAPQASSSFQRWSGEPGPLTDVRWIVVSTQSRVQLGSCGMYTEEGTGAQREVLNSRRDLHVRIVERSTGQEVSGKTLHGKAAGCGSIAFATSQGSALPQEAADAWVDAELERLRNR